MGMEVFRNKSNLTEKKTKNDDEKRNRAGSTGTEELRG